MMYLKTAVLVVVVVVTGCNWIEYGEKWPEEIGIVEVAKVPENAPILEKLGVSVRFIFKDGLLTAEYYQNNGALSKELMVMLNPISGQNQKQTLLTLTEISPNRYQTVNGLKQEQFGRYQITVTPTNGAGWELKGIANIQPKTPFWLRARSAKKPKIFFHRSS